MLFNKETIKNYTNADTGITIKRCHHFSLQDNNKLIGHFYFGLNDSIGILDDNYLSIRRQRIGLAKGVFELRNCVNNAIVGHLAISPFVAPKSLRITLDIIHQSLYNWQVLKANKGFNILTSKTWSKFSAKLFNESETATFEWDYLSHEIYKHRLESLPVTGKIELSNPKNYILLFAGIFLMEMELQMKAID